MTVSLLDHSSVEVATWQSEGVLQISPEQPVYELQASQECQRKYRVWNIPTQLSHSDIGDTSYFRYFQRAHLNGENRAERR